MKKTLFILTLTGLLFSCSSEKKIGYVENFKLYSEFTLTQELEKELTTYKNKEQKYLDSLGLIFQQQTNYLQSLEEVSKEEYAAYNNLRNTLTFKQSNFEEEVMTKSQEYDQQIWERINTYVTAYATENEYDLVLGAAGNGSLMFAKEDLDVTTELLEYCNNQYNGNVSE